jgi:hypothetical protein
VILQLSKSFFVTTRKGVDLPPISVDRYGAVGLPGAIFASYSPDNPCLETLELPVYTQDDSSGPTWSLEGVEKQYARWV